MKKILSYVTVLVLILSVCMAMTISVGAADVASADGVELSVTADKETYEKGDEIRFTVTVFNTNKHEITGVSVNSLIPEGFVIKPGSISFDRVNIKAGESYSAELTVITEEDASKYTEAPAVTDPSDTDADNNRSDSDDDISPLIFIIPAVFVLAFVIGFIIAKKKGIRLFSVILAVAMCLGSALIPEIDAASDEIRPIDEIKVTTTFKYDRRIYDISFDVTYDEVETSLKIGGKDISEFSIVIPADSTEGQRTAASDLAEYLERIGSFKPAIKDDSTAKAGPEIVLGYTNRLDVDDGTVSELGDEGFIIRTAGDSLYIIGSNVRGTIYGVYTFLEEHLGCRFYSKSFEAVPKAIGVDLKDIDNKQIPKFEFRDSYWYSLSTRDSSVKNKVNSNHGRDFGEKLDASVGGGITYAEVLEGVGFVHTLPLILQTKKPGYDVYSPICFTSEENFDIVINFVRSYLQKNPNETIISLSHNDGAGACNCQNCRKALRTETYSGIMLQFINRIAAEFEEDYPNLRFDTLAYRSTQGAPKNTVPNDNVIVRFCAIDTCFRHPLSADCVEWGGGKTYDDLVAWSEICTNGNLYIWNYTTNFTDFHMTYANFDNFWNDMQLFLRLGVTGVFQQGNIASDSGEFGTLKGYIIARLLWNPEMAEEEYWAMIDEFMEDYYGKGGSHLREFIDYSLENSTDAHFGIYFDDPGNYIYDHSYGVLGDNLTNAQGKKYIEGRRAYTAHSMELFANAKALASPMQFERIEQAEIQIYNYIVFTCHKSDWYGLFDASVKKELRDANEIIYNRIKKYGITHVTEFTVWDNKLVNFYSYVLQWGWDKRGEWEMYEGPYGDTLADINKGQVNYNRPDQK